ncbi:MAG: D-aminoacyl-tRNA deacylase [Clostridia bacterium]
MKCIVQRVTRGCVSINGVFSGEIELGLVVFVAYTSTDNEKCVDFCVDKIVNLRIFSDNDGKLNKSVLEIGGSVLLVSNFTVYGNTAKGRRPDFIKSASSEISKPMYDITVNKFKSILPLVTGEFGQDMQVTFTNDGPVTVIVEKENV